MIRRRFRWLSMIEAQLLDRKEILEQVGHKVLKVIQEILDLKVQKVTKVILVLKVHKEKKETLDQ